MRCGGNLRRLAPHYSYYVAGDGVNALIAQLNFPRSLTDWNASVALSNSCPANGNWLDAD